jgi:hypothetical protein
LLPVAVVRSHPGRAARHQAALLALAAIVAAAATVAFVRRPAVESDVAIPVGELRSQSAELRLLDAAVADGIARRFAEAHAGQLAQSIERSRDELASLKTLPRLDGVRNGALVTSVPLVAAGAALHDGTPLTAASAAAVRDAESALQSAEERLKR